MASYDHLISNEGKNLLRKLCGKRLEFIQGHRVELLDDGERVTFHSVARLHFDDGKAFDLHARFVHVDIAEEFWDDVGALSFGEAEGDIWLPEGVEAFKLPIGRVIDEVVLANDYDVLKHGEAEESSFAFAKAVLLRTGLEHIALSLDDFCEDAIVVRRGFDPEKLVPDGSGSWYDEPGWTDDYERRFERP